MLKELNILKYFFEEPNREFNIRELARITKISPPTISKKLKNFAKEFILSEKKERGFIFYKANLESTNYLDLKVYYNIHKIRNSGLIEELNNFYLKPTIILFGSFSTGLDTETSDIDLTIISENTEEFQLKDKFQKKLKREIQIFNIKELKDLNNKNLVNNILNGIMLQGEINGFK